MSQEEEVKKKKKKKSIVEAGDDQADDVGDDAANANGETPIKKKKKKKTGAALERGESKKKLKKMKSESAINSSATNGDAPVVKKKKKKKKKVEATGGESADDDDDDDFLPDSPLKDEPKRKVLNRSRSMDDGGGLSGSNHSTELAIISEDGGNQGNMWPSGGGRGMLRAQSLNFGRGGGMNRQGSVRNSMNGSGHGPGRGLGMGIRQGSRGGGLSVSDHGGRSGRGLGMRQGSRGGGLSVSDHGGRSGRGLGMRQPSRGGGLSVSEHGGRGMGMRQPSRGGGLSVSEHGGRGMGMRQPSMRQSSRFNGGLDGGSAHGSKRVGLGRQPSVRGSASVGMDGNVDDKSVVSGRGRPTLADKRSMSQQSMSLSSRSLELNDFSDDPKWKQVLRYFYILQPTPDETKSQRRQRYVTWLALVLDFIAAMVSIFSYDEATRCCGVPIFDTASKAIDWDVFIRVTTYIYTGMLFIEVIPVLKKGLPINLVNPLLGFMITFGMFFDDRIAEAIMMWMIEATAIACEVYVFFLIRKEFHEGNKRIEDATAELESRKKKRRKLGRSASKSSFSDDGLEEGPNEDLKYLDNFRLERERRQLKVAQSAEEINLRYHFIGTCINCGLVILSLSLIAGVAKNGGLCIQEMNSPPIFADDQKQRCAACFTPESLGNLNIWDEEGYTCQLCDESGKGKHTCYFGYVSEKQ